jgi:hypothetical protein
MEFQYNDGGRKEAGYKGESRDCVCRAIAIVTGKPYQEVYDALNELASKERIGKRKKSISNSRTGVHKHTYNKYLLSLGMKWVSCMSIGSGCKVHLRANELPKGKIICSVSRHLVAVIDGVINDTHDCSRDGNRCVYGYFIF